MSPSALTQIARVCVDISNEVSDEHGFVSMRKLLARFHARLIIQPLLVEGMLASVQSDYKSMSDAAEWAVLIDSETYPVDMRDIENENLARPLATRLRNTIAHELVHSLAFRSSEFGLRLNVESKRKLGVEELVKEIEKETERFSPLLLLSERALAQLLTNKQGPIAIEEICEFRRKFAISRYVFINRLNLLRAIDENALLSKKTSRNIAIGLAEWCERGKSVIRKWPLYFNYDNGIVPAFLLEAMQKDYLPIEATVSDSDFIMCGGARNSVKLVVDAGTTAAPRERRLNCEISAESGIRKIGSQFLFVVHAT